MVLTALPRVLVEVEPLCRSCKKPERKDCRAAVLAEVPADEELAELEEVAELEDAADDAADDAEPVLELPDVVPPRSAINFENAVFKSEITVEDTVAGAPSAVDVSVTNSLLLKSLMSDVSAAVIRDCP